MHNKFSSYFDAKVLRVYSKAKIAKGRRALCRKIFGVEWLLNIAGKEFKCFWLKDLPSSG